MRYIRITAVLLLSACGDGGTAPTTPTTTPTPPTPVATSISLSATTLSFSSLGEQQQLSATVKDQNGATMASATVTWASSDIAVATVSAGLVTSVGSGSTTITATSGSASANTSVSVEQLVASCEDIQYSFTDLGLVLSATDVGQADPMAPVANPSALQLDDGSIRLFFTNAGDGIASAISDDGITFSYETIRISGPDAKDQGVQLGPSRIFRLQDGRVRLYVGSSESGISSFISNDEGKTFTVEPGERITRTQANMDAIQKLSIVTLSDGSYRGYFGPAPQHGPTAVLADTGGPPDHWLLSATSSDLLDWSIEPGVRIGPGSTVLTASAREVYPLLRDDGCVTLFYQLNKPQDAGISDYDGVAVVGYSTSSDGLTFTKQFPLITTRDPAGPDVFTMPDGSRLLYHDSTDRDGYGHGIRVGRLDTIAVAGHNTLN